MNKERILELEAKGCFDFFWKEATLEGKGYGLIHDNTGINSKHVASVASVGFGLSAIVIGVERGWISYEEGYERVLGTLKTLYYNVEQKEGFFYHFVNMKSGKREWKCEVSIIDTALCVMGALSASEYFGEEIKEYFKKIYHRINWEWYRDKDKNMFYMGYHGEKGFIGFWDLYAEQLIMYVLAAASPTHTVDPSIYYAFGRKVGKYNDFELVYTHTGSLFTYQFSHAWIDFRNKEDKLGMNWFENSVKATLANRKYCIDNPNNLKTFNENAWGMTACETPHGYDGREGGLPSYNNTTNLADGTIPPCGAIGSIVFTPKESIEAMNYFYDNFPKLWGKYGFKDSFNLDTTLPWFSSIEIGINKGISLLMLENYRSGLIWKLTMQNEYIKKGLQVLEIKEVKKGDSDEIVVA